MPDAPSLFVLMPFGEREIALETGHPRMDFDAFYSDAIRPAAVDAGWRPTRADELVGPDSIMRSIVGALSGADAVLGDLTSVNGNVLYELGVWHALGTGPTLLTARKGTPLPFDVRDQRVLMYDDPERPHNRQRTLTDIKTWLEQLLPAIGTPVGNPIEGMLTRYAVRPQSGSLQADKELRLRIDRADSPEKLLAAWGWGRGLDVGTSVRLELAAKLAAFGAHDEAVSVLGGDSEEADYEVLQRRALSKRRASKPDLAGAEADLKRSLSLNPDDPEGLGLLGGVLRRQGSRERALACYRQARRFSPSSLYLRTAEAELTLLIGDHDSARIQYGDILGTLRDNALTELDPWQNLVAAEASFVLGQDDHALTYVARAKALGATIGQLTSLEENLTEFAAAEWRPDAARVLTSALGLDAMKASVERPNAHVGTPKRSVQIIHMSDIHFGQKQVRGGKRLKYRDMHFFPEDDENTPTLRETLSRDILGLAQFGQIDLSKLVLVVSGDFTYRGCAEEFDKASTFLTGLCDDIGLPRERVILVPGNHDVNWETAKASWECRFDDYLTFSRLLPPGTPVVAVMHHHLHPYPETLAAPKRSAVFLDKSIVRDAGVLERALARLGTVVLLHGHKHKAQARQTALVDRHTETDMSDVELVVNGVGSIGVAKSESDGDEAHQYAVIDVNWESRISFTVGIRWRELGLWPGARWTWQKSWDFVR